MKHTKAVRSSMQLDGVGTNISILNTTTGSDSYKTDNGRDQHPAVRVVQSRHGGQWLSWTAASLLLVGEGGRGRVVERHLLAVHAELIRAHIVEAKTLCRNRAARGQRGRWRMGVQFPVAAAASEPTMGHCGATRSPLRATQAINPSQESVAALAGSAHMTLSGN